MRIRGYAGGMQSERTGSPRVVIAAALVALAGISYSSWVLEFLWSSPLDPLRSFLSELDALHRPHRDVYVAGDVIAACCAMLAAALLLLPRPHFRGFPAITAVIALAMFGVSTISDALLPIECIPGVDPGCPSEPSGLFPQLHHIHALTSTLAVVSIFAVMIAATVSAFRDRIWPQLKMVGTVALGVIGVSTAWMLAADNLGGDFVLGLAQRIQVGGMTVWLVIWGVALATPALRPVRWTIGDRLPRYRPVLHTDPRWLPRISPQSACGATSSSGSVHPRRGPTPPARW
ncbi:hypothetical protein GORHZ_164_00535 [Gordonia rhizosphera NBRC 16068]|uniref:DUF998 domain-containing protein n=1 Tax=Gordonia rhizosphera NBRC 16068 TaxID=1108045 RepID=K6VZ20_9ACTN|nr:hypothetical protein GORHZ_164_00535 [Gordonia rhizosphera NBRC 16068]